MEIIDGRGRIPMKIFRQIVLVFFFRTENKDGIELSHLHNAMALVILTNGTENLCRSGKSGKR